MSRDEIVRMTNEVLVEYHHKEAPGSTRVDLDVFRIGSGSLDRVWSGPVRVDTAEPSLGMPPSDREKFVREIEFARTAAAQGRRICFRKTVSVAAGAAFAPPRVLFEDLDMTGQPGAPAGPGPGE